MKWIVRVIGALLMAALVAVAALLFLPAERVAAIAADQLRKVTGRQVSITGDVALSFWPVLGVRADGLEVGNADWSRQGPMLSARKAAIGVDALSLLRGEIRITNIEAESPTIRLEQRADGRASWQFSDASGTATIATETSPAQPAQPFSIERLSVTDAQLIYDAEGSDLVSYSGVDLTLDWPERLGPADLKAVLRPAGEEVAVDAAIQGFAGFITGQVQPVEVQITAGAGSASLSGRAGTAGEVAGALRLKTADTGRFLRALGIDAGDLPRGLGRTIDMAADLTLTPDRRLALRALEADLGGNRITGAADIALNGVPQVNAQLAAGRLDLSGATGGSGGGGGGAADAGWSKARIDAGGLAAFNGDIALRAESIDLGGFRLGATRALLRNDRSRMVFELREVAAYAGTLTGEFVVNNRNGLSVGGDIAARGIDIQPLLRDAAGLSRLNGRGDAELSFLGAGPSVDAIMRSLSGKGGVRLGKGTIEGINLDRLMRSGEVGAGTTVFDSFGASFAIDKGVLRNDDLLLLLASYQARGAGTVDLGGRRIDYLFTPTATRANGGRGVAIPVRIVGPWSNPKIQPDLQAAIELNLAEEKKALENRVKEQAEKKLREELGVVRKDGQSVEDAVKDKAEDALKKGLLKLLK